MSDTPESERDPRPVSARQRGAAARTREPGRPAARAEAAGRTEGTGRTEGAGRIEGTGRTEGTGRIAARHRIGIRELRQHASVYVDLAEKGYTVDITNRGRLVAQLIPVREPGSPLERLIAAGIIEPAEEAGGVGDLEPYPPPATRPAGQP